MEKDEILAIEYNIDKWGEFYINYITTLNEYNKIKHKISQF